MTRSLSSNRSLAQVERLRGLLAEADAFVPYGDPTALKIRLREALPLHPNAGSGERDRYREALDTVAYHHDISDGALEYLREALNG